MVLADVPQQLQAETLQGSNPYFAPYLKPGELPDDARMPLFQEVWRIIGYRMNEPNVTARVKRVAEGIFAAYSYHGQVTMSIVSMPAPTHLDGHLGASLLSS